MPSTPPTCPWRKTGFRVSLTWQVPSRWRTPSWRLSRYRGEVYQEFTDLLENACVQSSETELVRYQTLAQAVITQLEEVNQTTSPLAYRIVDKPELYFSPQIRERLNQIIERIDAQ